MTHSAGAGPGSDEGSGKPAELEADRLRDAYRRRGPVEGRLAGNRGQKAIVRERDRAIVQLLMSDGHPPFDLLDVGCGEGRTLAMLNESGVVARGVGVDLLPERIERARQASPGLDFRVADGTRLPFPDESFDVALAMTVFSSVAPSMRQAIATEIARVVRPGGRFAWYDMRRPSPSNPDVRPFTGSDAHRLFRGWAVSTRAITVAPPVARRLGPLTGPVYPVLAHLPVLLTHEVGSAVRPQATDRAGTPIPGAPRATSSSPPRPDA